MFSQLFIELVTFYYLTFLFIRAPRSSTGSRLTQVRFLPAVVRFRLHDEPGLRYLRHWGQEDTCREESQEEERLRQVERRFAMSEPVENFEEMGHLGHLGH